MSEAVYVKFLYQGWGSSMAPSQVDKRIKFIAYPAIAIAAGGALLGVAAIALGWLQVGVSVGPIGAETAMMPGGLATVSAPGTEVAARSSATTTVEPVARPATISLPQEQPIQQAANSLPPRLSVTSESGGLRVSNQTDYPVRVALLSQQTDNRSASTKGASAATYYGQPAHWDFAPGEGSLKGLKLSLPDQSVQLRPGDVLVAFAQDGSQQYWGPFVVGETAEPAWNNQTSEWQLNLQP